MASQGDLLICGGLVIFLDAAQSNANRKGKKGDENRRVIRRVRDHIML